MNKSVLVCILAFLMATSVSAQYGTYGVDVSQPVDAGTFQCLIDNYGIAFNIARGYMSYGAVDYNAIGTNENAQSVGLTTDVYFFPCIGADPNGMVSDFVSNMVDGNGNDVYGTVWIDVETNPSGGCGWSDDINYNCQFLSDIVTALQNNGKLVGIYSSYYMWESIFGDAGNCAWFTNIPVWYAHYDYSASFSDWYGGLSFGGWSNPNMKQYDGDETACGVGVDFNVW